MIFKDGEGKICSLKQVGECFSSFRVPGYFSQMMANGIILGQISFKFSGSLFPKREHFGSKGTIPEGPRSLIGIPSMLVVISKLNSFWKTE